MKTLLVVDMQKGFINQNNSHLVDGINFAIRSGKFDDYIFTKFCNDENTLFVKVLNWTSMTTGDQDIIVEVPPDSIILTKNKYGLTEEQIDLLKQKGIKEVYLCGTDIDACVLAIAYNLFDNGIKPVFVMNLCSSSSRNPQIKEHALEIIKRNFGENCMVKEI